MQKVYPFQASGLTNPFWHFCHIAFMHKSFCLYVRAPLSRRCAPSWQQKHTGLCAATPALPWLWQVGAIIDVCVVWHVCKLWAQLPSKQKRPDSGRLVQSLICVNNWCVMCFDNWCVSIIDVWVVWQWSIYVRVRHQHSLTLAGWCNFKVFGRLVHF